MPEEVTIVKQLKARHLAVWPTPSRGCRPDARASPPAPGWSKENRHG